MEAEALVDQYLALLGASPESPDDDVIQELIKAGATPEDAWQAAQLVPAAFCRALMAPDGVTFGTGYVLLDERSQNVGGGPLSELPIFTVASARAEAQSDKAFASAVARRSADFQAIDMALRDGAKPDAISVGDVTFIDARLFENLGSRGDAPSDPDVIYCEVCNLPHRKGVAICEDCGHALGRLPDWLAIKGHRSSQGCSAVAAFSVVLAMVLLNFWAFGGAGYIIALLPFVWLVKSGYRYRVLSKSLARHQAR